MIYFVYISGTENPNSCHFSSATSLWIKLHVSLAAWIASNYSKLCNFKQCFIFPHYALDWVGSAEWFSLQLFHTFSVKWHMRLDVADGLLTRLLTRTQVGLPTGPSMYGLSMQFGCLLDGGQILS